VDPELLATAFEIARLETMCADATLEIERVPVRWVCRGCGREIPQGQVLRCGACGSPAKLAGGDEIVLAQLQLEVVDV
jgi:hydrogenase nickel incorporation protein HypA/HybF